MKTLKDFEDSTFISKAKECAYNFYNDDSISYEERLIVFNKYGKSLSKIFKPKSLRLKVIFENYLSITVPYIDELISCEDVIDDFLWRYDLDSKFKRPLMEHLFKEGILEFRYNE